MPSRIPTRRKKLCPPKNVVNGVRTHPDGCEVCQANKAGGDEYKRRTLEMAQRQGNTCAICGQGFDSLWVPATFDHQDGRGSGGGHRDDRTEFDRRWLNAALCMDCQGVKGSKRYHWRDGKYVPVTESSAAQGE